MGRDMPNKRMQQTRQEVDFGGGYRRAADAQSR